MKITVELHGATKDLSKNNFLEFEIKKNSSIKDIKIQILKFIEKNFNDNQNLKKLIRSSAFCSEEDEIVSENYKINDNQVIGIIPPIGGG
jgi:molybdopterin converting factor small subunit|tara:strand:+ start:1559 stop:1828 length:270 start_codon:yes stop_codon:yes gene_type:complete